MKNQLMVAIFVAVGATLFYFALYQPLSF